MNVHFPRGDTESPEDHGPKFDFRPGDIVRLGRPEGGYVRTLQYKGRIAASSATGFRPAEPSHLHFEAVPDASSVFLTDRDISFRAKAGEFEVVVATEQADKPRPQMLTNLSLTDTEAKVARRYKRYVDACLALGPDFRRSHLVLEPVIAKVAAELGEQPPSFSTVLRKFDQWCDMGGVYGTASLAPKRRKGNTSRPWSPRVLAMMRNCINRALQMPKGTARDAQAMLQAAVDEEYSETKSDIKLPALRTIEREFGKIDKYTRDFLRKGPGYAERKHAAYYERPRPELPLEEAEVDHTTFDIRLIDDESP